jgi:hypothetical protein
MVRVLVVVVAVSLSACSGTPKKMNFLHTSVRETYLMQPEELKELQFYISESVLAQSAEGPAAGATQLGDVVVVAPGTKGAVTEVGPNWLRVSFEEGGQGVLFVSDTSKPEDRYWLATTAQGSPDVYKLKDLPDKVLEIQGRRYKVVNGADAYLLLDRKDFDELVADRRHIKGRVVPQD